MFYYTVYKTTNVINQRYYIGMHKTDNPYDKYLGSGKLLKRAIEKYSRQYFSKEILFIFDNEEKMKAKEAEVVVPNSIDPKSYNLCPGGHGGFGYINSSQEIILKRDKREYKVLGAIIKNKLYAGKRKHIFESRYYLNPKFCLECKEIIVWEKKDNKFCNQSCGAKFNNRQRKISFG